MKKLFVSVPMRGRTHEEIIADMAKMHKIAEVFEGEELELIDSFVTDKTPETHDHALWCLGESIKRLAEADVFIGIESCWRWRGCEIEARAAQEYGIKTYFVPSGVMVGVERDCCDEPKTTPVNG